METKRKTGIAIAYNGLTITWSDIEGKSLPITIAVGELSDAIREQGMLHGIDQKVTDAGAMGTDHWDGKDKAKRPATTAERLARMRRVADNLVSGNWNVRQSADPLANKTPEQLEQLMAAIQAKLTAIGVS
jgi:hypothetical protein